MKLSLFASMGLATALLGAGCGISPVAPVAPVNEATSTAPMTTSTIEAPTTTSSTGITPPPSMPGKMGKAKVEVSGSFTGKEEYMVHCRETDSMEHTGYHYDIDMLGTMKEAPGKFAIVLETSDRRTGARKLDDTKANKVEVRYFEQGKDGIKTYNFNGATGDRQVFTVGENGSKLTFTGNLNELNSDKRITVNVDAACTL